LISRHIVLVLELQKHDEDENDDESMNKEQNSRLESQNGLG
jgi:hypothetical protein